MKLLNKLLPAVIRHELSQWVSRQSKCIFYRIIEVDELREQYTLQCVNTRAIFYAHLASIISDKNVIYRLHPTQSCYMGIEYARKLNDKLIAAAPRPIISGSFFVPQTTYRLCYQDRKNNLCFVNNHTKEEHIMDPRDIVLSEALIEGFNAIDAFHIGLQAGLKMYNSEEKQGKAYDELGRPHLWLVK